MQLSKAWTSTETPTSSEQFMSDRFKITSLIPIDNKQSNYILKITFYYLISDFAKLYNYLIIQWEQPSLYLYSPYYCSSTLLLQLKTTITMEITGTETETKIGIVNMEDIIIVNRTWKKLWMLWYFMPSSFA